MRERTNTEVPKESCFDLVGEDGKPVCSLPWRPRLGDVRKGLKRSVESLS